MNNSLLPEGVVPTLIFFLVKIMSNGCVATMSTLGFITSDFNLAMDRHITYFFASRRDQLKIIENVPSFEYTLMQYQGDKKRLMGEMKTTLIKYFLEIADSVEVAIGSTELSEEDGKYTLNVAVQCVKNNKIYDLQTAVLVSGKSFQQLRTARGN